MNKLRNYFMIAAIAAISFTSCSKDDPTPEVDQEEFDGSTFIFTEGHFHGEDFHASGDTLQVRFVNGSNKPYPAHIHLHEGDKYQLEIMMYKNGEDITSEFTPEEHQWFFVGAPNGVLDYQYLDNQVGFKGIFTVNQATEGFDLQAVLRHGLNKSSEAAQTWNNPNNKSAGGEEDFNKSFEIHPVEGDHESHDH